MGGDNANDEVLDAVTPGEARNDWKNYEKASEEKMKPKPMPGATADALSNDNARHALAKHVDIQKGNRFSLAADHVDIPEQVVGSVHQFDMPIPMNMDASGRKAWIYVQVHGESLTAKTPSFEAASIMAGTSGITAARAVALEFAPARPGVYPASVVVRGEWDDGHVEERVTRVSGKARLIDQAPTTKPSGPAKDVEQLEAPPPSENVTTVESAVDLIKNTNNSIANRRLAGVAAVEAENEKFKAPPTPPSGWELLAELAVTLTSAALGGLVGPQIGKAVSHSVAALGFKAGEKQIEEAIGKGAEDILKETSTASLKSPAGKKPEGKSDEKAPAPPPPPPLAISTDTTVNFFAMQSLAIEATREKHENGMIALKDRLVTEHGVDSASAVAGLLAVNDAMRAIEPVAAIKQASFTTNKFAAFKSQSTQGAENVSTAAGEVSATKFDKPREDAGNVYVKRADGVLDLELEGSSPADIRPVAAHMAGVSRSSVTRFLTADLANAGVPLTLRWGYRAIYRDEAGRVRVENWGGAAHAEKEVQSVALAEAIVNRVVSRSLTAWGVANVESNDVG